MTKFRNLLLGLFALSACDKLDVEAPDFAVTMDKTEYKVDETAQFYFSGKADMVTFYSGEGGANYDFRERTTAEGTPQLQFSTLLENAGTVPEVNTLRLMASTNFSGSFDSASIRRATWTDITSRAKLSTGPDDKVVDKSTPSGTVNLSDFLSADKPLYLAFRYLGYRHAVSRQPKWTIRSFSVSNVVENGFASTTSTIDQIGWRAIDVLNPTVVWSVPTTGQAVIDGQIANSTQDNNNDWLISKPLDLKRVLPNVGVPIKQLTGKTITSHSYIFKKAGTYKVTFVAMNGSVDERKTEVKQVDIVVTP